MDINKNYKTMQDIKNELMEFLVKWYVWILYILIGMVAHVSNMLITRKNRSFLQVLGSTGAALFIGYLSSMYCIANCPEQGKFIVPIATLMSDKIFNYLVGLDWESITANFLQIFKQKND